MQGVLIAQSEAPSANNENTTPSREERFQVQLGNRWQDVDDEANEQLRGALLAGLPNVTLETRGQSYECSLQHMEQRNLQTGRVRCLRAPGNLAASSNNGSRQPVLFQPRRFWEEEEDEDDEESLGSPVSVASPSHGTSCCMRPKVAAVTAGVVTGASVCVVGGEYLFGDGELYAGLVEGTQETLDWTAEATKSMGDFLENVL